MPDQPERNEEFSIDPSTRTFFRDAHETIKAEEQLESHLARVLEKPFAPTAAADLSEFLVSDQMTSAREASRRLGLIDGELDQ